MNLPIELWTQVFEHLSSETNSHRDLYSACLVSHKFCSVAQPILYRDIVNPDDIDQFRLLRTLTSKPHLAQHVRSWEFSSDYLTLPGRRKILETVTRSLQLPPRFRAFLQKLNLCSDDQYHSRAGPLLLALTPQTQRLNIFMLENSDALVWLLSSSELVEQEWTPEESDCETEESAHSTHLEAPIDPVSFNGAPAREPTADEIALHGIKAFTNYGLPHLTKLELFIGSRDFPGPSMSEFEPLLLHPTLRVLDISRVCYSTSDIEEMKWPDRKCNLRTLILQDSMFDHGGLLNIVTRCHSLASLVLVHGNPDGDGGRPADPFHLRPAGDALREHGKNLVMFVLDLRCGGKPRYERQENGKKDPWSFGSLRKLPLLQTLKTAGFSMMDEDI